MGDLHCPARVFLARHGETSYDGAERLTPDGEQQARDLAVLLRTERIARVYASTMPRSVLTAEIAAAGLGAGVELWDELVEAGVESNPAVVGRIEGALEEIADRHRGEAVLVVAHLAATGLTLPRLTAVPDIAAGWDHGAVIALEADAHGWRVVPHSGIDGVRLGNP